MNDKKLRLNLIKAQHECCPVCGKRFSVSEQICYDVSTNSMLDRKCLMLMAHMNASLKRGVTLERIAEFINKGVPIRPQL